MCYEPENDQDQLGRQCGCGAFHDVPTGAAADFFYEYAGYSYDPASETAEQGRRRCADKLAAAESAAREAGWSFAWEIDRDTDSSEWSDEQPPWQLWGCIARDGAGEVAGSLWGIDFGRDVEPWGQPYRRVVEAELADEATRRCVPTGDGGPFDTERGKHELDAEQEERAHS